MRGKMADFWKGCSVCLRPERQQIPNMCFFDGYFLWSMVEWKNE